MDIENLIECGTEVIIGDDVKGIVLAICIRGRLVTYEVSWWNGRSRQCEWIAPCEFVLSTGPPDTFGFNYQRNGYTLSGL